eukprot:Filipodium_phascolosomae@DN4815_c0_g1_i1.p1
MADLLCRYIRSCKKNCSVMNIVLTPASHNSTSTCDSPLDSQKPVAKKQRQPMGEHKNDNANLKNDNANLIGNLHLAAQCLEESSRCERDHNPDSVHPLSETRKYLIQELESSNYCDGDSKISKKSASDVHFCSQAVGMDESYNPNHKLNPQPHEI